MSEIEVGMYVKGKDKTLLVGMVKAIRLYDPRDYNGLYSQDGMEVWLCDGPRDVTEARHMAGYRMRWRTKSGTLIPVPNRTIGASDE